MHADALKNMNNVHYGACFSVVFALTIVPKIDANQTGSVSFFMESSAVLPYIILIVYFFVDCISSNVRRGDHLSHPIYSVGSVVWIWILGYCAIALKSPDPIKYILLSFYFLVARIIQYNYYSRHVFEVSDVSRIFYHALIVIGILLSFVLGSIGAYQYFATKSASADFENLDFAYGFNFSISTDGYVSIVLFVMLILKLLELWKICISGEASPENGDVR